MATVMLEAEMAKHLMLHRSETVTVSLIPRCCLLVVSADGANAVSGDSRVDVV